MKQGEVKEIWWGSKGGHKPGEDCKEAGQGEDLGEEEDCLLIITIAGGESQQPAVNHNSRR